MARPARISIPSETASWDGELEDNLAILFDAPLPIHEDAAFTTLALLQSSFPAANYARCFVWANLTTFGYCLVYSDGAAWIVYGGERRPLRALTGSASQLITDKFVRFSGAGPYTYSFLTASAWAGMTVEVRNDAVLAGVLDPNSTELINGSATSLALPAGSTARIYSDGTVLYAAIST